MQNYVVFQAYGSTAIIHEAMYAILSLYRFGDEKNFQLVIYTDNKAVFQEYMHDVPISYELVTPTQIQSWRGEQNFVHRFKIKMLQDFFSKYTGNVLYVDTDVVFRESLTPIFEQISKGQLFMHLAEGQLDKQKGSLAKKITRFVKNNEFINPNTSSAEHSIKISSTTVMWNAGVLGLSTSFHTPLLDTILWISDAMYSRYQKHVMEQLAFSYCLQTHSVIKPTEYAIYHYWFFKEFRTVLASFFKKYKGASLETLRTKVDTINPEVLVVPKKNYEAMPKWKRWWWKLRKKTWHLAMECH